MQSAIAKARLPGKDSATKKKSEVKEDGDINQEIG
jgi:hypothetical protein